MGFSPKDALLKAQVLNFSAVLTADPTVYQQTPAVALQVKGVVDAYVDALDTLTEARANGVRSEQQTATRNSKRTEMLDLLRPIYAYVQDSTAISDAAKIALGVHVKSTKPTPQPVPQFAPLTTVVKVNGSIVTLRMANPEEPDSNARPIYTAGISVFSYVGENPPAQASDFRFEGSTGQTTIDVALPPTVAAGATVWFTCFYFNNRKESGPACTPIRTTIGAGTNMPQMRLAA